MNQMTTASAMYMKFLCGKRGLGGLFRLEEGGRRLRADGRIAGSRDRWLANGRFDELATGWSDRSGVRRRPVIGRAVVWAEPVGV